MNPQVQWSREPASLDQQDSPCGGDVLHSRPTAARPGHPVPAHTCCCFSFQELCKPVSTILVA